MSGIRLEVSVPGVDPATSDRAALVGVCRPDGSVRSYRGAIQVVNGSEGENRTVNRVPVDQYLRGVVPRESPASWGSAAGGAGMHALRAQAVAARTYGLAERRYTYAGTCDTDACQVYGGAATRAGGPGDALAVLEDARTDTAIADTAGVVRHAGDGTLAYTQFNSSSGGFTSGANFPVVADVGDGVAANPWNRWTLTRARTDVEAAFPAVGSVTNIDVTRRNGIGEWGGRVLAITVRGTAGAQSMTGQQFATALGLPSAWFDVPAGCAGPTPTTTTPAAGPLLFNQIAPRRLVDTRIGLNASRAPVAGGCVLSLRPASIAQLPAAARAVSLNVTVTDPLAAGFVTAYPCDRGVPLASTVNFRAGQTVANQVSVPLDGNGEVCVYALQRTELVIDLLGWFGVEPGGAAASAGGGGERFSPLAPTRLADTRTGTGGAPGPVAAGGSLVVPLGAAGLPAGARPAAVVLNVTSTESAAPGFVTAYACGSERPLASNLNPAPGIDVAAHVVAPVGADGTVCLYTLQPTHLVVDVTGWYGSVVVPAGPGSGAGAASVVAPVPFRALVPSRLLDTRSGGGPVVGLAAGRALTVAGAGGVPATGVRAVVLNVTATGATGPGFVTVYPCDGGLPLASNLNVTVGFDVANLVTVPVDGSGSVCLYVNRTVDLVVDVSGWYG
jgi:SpoIID/LytB domain protein